MMMQTTQTTKHGHSGIWNKAIQKLNESLWIKAKTNENKKYAVVCHNYRMEMLRMQIMILKPICSLIPLFSRSRSRSFVICIHCIKSPSGIFRHNSKYGELGFEPQTEFCKMIRYQRTFFVDDNVMGNDCSFFLGNDEEKQHSIIFSPIKNNYQYLPAI